MHYIDAVDGNWWHINRPPISICNAHTKPSYTIGKSNCISLTLLDLTSEQLVQGGMDKACIPSIFIKTSQFFFGESCLMSAFTKKNVEKLRMIEIGPRGC